jgi:hypothetical protein
MSNQLLNQNVNQSQRSNFIVFIADCVMDDTTTTKLKKLNIQQYDLSLMNRTVEDLIKSSIGGVWINLSDSDAYHYFQVTNFDSCKIIVSHRDETQQFIDDVKKMFENVIVVKFENLLKAHGIDANGIIQSLIGLGKNVATPSTKLCNGLISFGNKIKKKTTAN